MGVQRYEYELSVWKESLARDGLRKNEKKMAIIGANDMGYLGKASNIKFRKKMNGTHELEFEMPDKYFDSKTGEFIHNDFVDALFNECKIKFFYKKEWYEFSIKKVSDVKNFKSYMRTYLCSDSFIDELSRNGYGITFDEELYNNVEEIGIFSEEILEDSVWEYDPSINWGDFTEYTEEKLLRVPLSLFGGTLRAHKLFFNLGGQGIKNIITGETRNLEMGDDYARAQGKFWDQYGGENQLLSQETIIDDKENNYIYVPYTQLDFCYVSSDENKDNGLEDAFAATEYPANYLDKGYAIAPTSIDPNSLIEFMFIPENAKLQVDEAGLIVNKEFTYVITVKEWNEQIVNSELFYKFENYREFIDGSWQKKKVLVDTYSDTDYIYGNRAAYYDGYLDEITKQEILTGKKIAISDRTEVNISSEINQYVKVYNNLATEYQGLYTSEDWEFDPIKDKDYRVCSKIETRQIVPQLARNLVQNGKGISQVTGWEIMHSEVSSGNYHNASIVFGYDEEEQYISVDGLSYEINVGKVKDTYLTFTPAYKKVGDSNIFITDSNEKNAVTNFGILGQEKKIEKGRIYALGIIIKKVNNTLDIPETGNFNSTFIRIGNGELVSDGDYQFKENQYIDIPITYFNPENNSAVGYILINSNETYDNPYVAIYSNVSYQLSELTLFEAYTRGIDNFDTGYFRYSGRDLFTSYTPNSSVNNDYLYSDFYTEEQLRTLIIFEDTVMTGDIYSQYKYFIQQLRTKDGKTYDTFMAKSYLSPTGSDFSLPLNSGLYTEDDYEIITNYIDLNNCDYYNKEATAAEYDCSYEGNHVCLYQKYGYCPYRFQTEKHCRKIRTLKGERSNRFNLTQELGKNFKVYPVYYISHNINNGKVLTQKEAYEQGLRNNYTEARADYPDKRIYYITEKGKENKLGFRYEKNLENISRTIISDKITTKLYVLDTDSEISRTGLCSIKTAEDNPSKDSFIIDFSYYITKGLLNKEITEADLYGKNENDMGYLKTLGYLNTQYDNITNKIINISAQSFTELSANLNVNLTGIETAQKQLRDLEKKLSKYTVQDSESYLNNKTFQSYQYEYMEQYSIYVQLILDTFYTNNRCIYGDISICPPADFLNRDVKSVDEIKKQWVDTHSYEYGILGQYNKEYNQLSELRKEQQKYQKRILDLSSNFFKKYEPYLKEGTWSDTNFISDNAYYLRALDVAKQGAIPEVQYSISTVDIEVLYKEGDYEFDTADTTYVEDIGMFGINPRTGLPNRLKTIISAITECPDLPLNNKIEVANYTTQFEDLFQQVTATVQTLTFNENIYNRSSNFTSLQNIKTNSLQGALDENNIELVHTDENNVQMNWEGQQGSDINNHNNKYKLNGQGLFFSNNGGESWNTAVTPKGINADYIKTGTLDASKIRIVDGNYIYFGWNRDGIFAYRDPQTISQDNSSALDDYASFNKYGLSLVEKGKIKLRAGYSFRSTNGGNINSEKELSGENKIGFYLYNSEGIPIFSTETSSQTAEAAKETARIRLVGEILTTNKAMVEEFQSYKYGEDCYTTEEIEYNKFSNEQNIITNLSGVVISGTTVTYTRVASDQPADDCAAFIAYKYSTDNLTQIDIIDDGQTISYNDPIISQGVEDKWGSFDDQRFFYFNSYEINYSNQSSKIFIILDSSGVSFKTVTSQELSITYNKKAYNKTQDEYGYSEVLLSQIDLTAIDCDHSLATSSYRYYQLLTINNLYKIENKYYSEFLGEESTTSSGAVALYINNRTDLNSETEVDSNSRIFSCCKSNGITVENIFTILKDGSLHMGGIINNASDVNNLADQIWLSNESIIIDSSGILKMSFDSIKDINSNKSIITYVQDSLSSATSGIVSQITGRYHNHSIPLSTIDWERPENTIYLNGIAYNPSQLYITITTHDHQVFQATLYDVLYAFNYYQTLYYGNNYTNYSTI